MNLLFDAEIRMLSLRERTFKKSVYEEERSEEKFDNKTSRV